MNYTFKKIYMINIFNMLKLKLQEIADNFNLNYDELEELYLKDIKLFIES